MNAAGEISDEGMAGVLSNSAFSRSYYESSLSFLSWVILEDRPVLELLIESLIPRESLDETVFLYSYS